MHQSCAIRLQCESRQSELPKSIDNKGKDDHESVDRTIDYKQFVNAIHSCGLNWLVESDIKSMFRTVDRDDSGLISFREWIVVLESAINEG